MSAALDKRYKAREQQIAAGGHAYTLRRPTAAQLARLGEGSRLDMLRECVVGWDLTWLDLFPGGDPVPATFTPELWSDFLDDSPDIWRPLGEALLDLIRAHQDALEDAKKN
jgi:hypothetical protein